ncbi:universal stress protein [Piscinibacter koreensis]|uniref:Universal stress protein n=1 Tax=Piscinibacter koreensis TaxID=2742824 RepID=A0A7Y6NQK8_9BURK|nr:universal stress protein [Schlegelella koreensis]
MHLAHGNAAEEIGRVAREVGADLLVVGHREQGRLSRWWRGSVGASLLTHAPCSILVAVSHTEVG